MPENSRHHVWFERKDYKTKNEKSFRNLGGFVIVMEHEAHRQLHFNVDPPPKLYKWQMSELEHDLNLVPFEDRKDPLWGLDILQDYLTWYGGDLADVVQENIVSQREYIDGAV